MLKKSFEKYWAFSSVNTDPTLHFYGLILKAIIAAAYPQFLQTWDLISNLAFSSGV